MSLFQPMRKGYLQVEDVCIQGEDVNLHGKDLYLQAEDKSLP